MKNHAVVMVKVMDIAWKSIVGFNRHFKVKTVESFCLEIKEEGRLFLLVLFSPPRRIL